MLPERLAALRRSRGMTQEQLAEALGVSRQSVSKWESGRATPELDRLRAICTLFGVTLDQLAGLAPLVPDEVPAEPSRRRDSRRLGAVLCLLGALCLLGTAGLLLARPSAAEQLDDSSVITLRGTGLLLTACLGLLAAGVVLLRRKK